MRNHLGDTLKLRRFRSLAIPLVAVCGVGAATAGSQSKQVVSEPPLVVLEVAVALVEPPADPVPAVVRLERLGTVGSVGPGGSAEGEDSSTTREIALEAPGTVSVEVAGGAVWQLSLDAPGLWAPPTIWRSEEGGRAELRAVPTGDLTGTLSPPPGEEHPEELTARFQAAGGRVTEPAERHTVDCRIADGGQHTEDAAEIAPFACAIPSGRFDVRLRAPGFVSHCFWNVEVPPGGEVDLGRRRLVAGASVVAWVKSEVSAPDFDVTTAEAELVPEAAGVEMVARDHQRRHLLELHSSPNERGFLEFSGVSPGSYRLRVSHPGFAESSFAPLVVVPGSETELAEIVLRRPSRLAVELQPPTLRQRPWFLSLSRHSDVPGHLDRIAAETAGLEGRWEQSGLSPGSYRLVVNDAHGSRWATREVDLGSGDHEVRIELPFERVEGRVTLGGEPLEGATVWLGGSHGETRISAVSDEEGAVYVLLPTRDAWPVEVRAERPPVAARLDTVELQDHPTQPWRLAAVDLAATGLRVEVTREGGGPVPRANVRLMREEMPPRFLIEPTDEDGRLLVQALKAGDWRVQADWLDEEDRKWISDGVAVSIGEERVEELRLMLRRPWSFSGQVAGPTGAGVFGAEVTGVPIYPEPGERATWVASAITGLAGEFELQVPAEATALRLTVLPPGFTARQWPAFERDSPPQVLTVDRHGGTLRLDGLPAPTTTPVEGQPGVFGLHRWSLSDLVRWSRLNGGEVVFEGGELVVPQMAPGRYSLCSSSTGRATAEAGAAGAAACNSGELLPYSDLALSVPSP